MLKGHLLVIGSGIAGMTSALDAAQMGIQVYMVEKAEQIGGKVMDYCCKATDQCTKCSACLAPQLKMKVMQNPLIKIFLQSVVSAINKTQDGYEIEITTTLTDAENGKLSREKIIVNAVIIAVGFTPYAPDENSEYGYGRYSNVITGLKLEKLLRCSREKELIKGHTGKVGFIQCVGSRDMAIGNNYCSAVCCMYAAKMARHLKHKMPNLDITVFYMDIQSIGQQFTGLSDQNYFKNINLIRGMPAKIYRVPGEKSVTVRYTDTFQGSAIEENFDLIVLAGAMCPSEDTQTLAKFFDLDINVHGFFQTDTLNAISTKHKRIFIAGACQSPKDIPASIRQAKSAVALATIFM